MSTMEFTPYDPGGAEVGEGSEAGTVDEGSGESEQPQQFEGLILDRMESYLSENPSKSRVLSEAIGQIYETGDLKDLPENQKAEFVGLLAGLASTILPMAVKGIGGAVAKSGGPAKHPIVAKAIAAVKPSTGCVPIGRVEIGKESYKIVK